MKMRGIKYRNLPAKILLIFFTALLVGCTCLPFSSPFSKTPITGAISYSDIITYIEVNASGNPQWSGWSGIADQNQTLKYSITPSSPYVTINEDTGEITVLANVLFSNNFTVTATGYGEFQDSVSTELSIKVRPPFLYNVYNVSDDDNLEIREPYSITTSTLEEGTTYLIVPGYWDYGLSLFSVRDDGSLVNITNIVDSDNFHFERPSSPHITKVGNTNYLFVTRFVDFSGVSMFSLGSDGTLVNVTNINDTSHDDNLEIFRPYSLTTAEVGGTTYLFVAGYHDSGMSVFSVHENGSLSNVFNVSDDNGLELEGAYDVTTAVVGGVTYLFVAGHFDDGVSVFSVGDDGTLNNVYNISDDDNDNLELEGAYSVAVSEIKGTTYLFVAGWHDDGVSVFSISDDGSLKNVYNISDDKFLELYRTREVITAVVEGITYLFVAGWYDDGVSVFLVRDDGSLENVANVNDNTILELEGASSLATSVVGGTTYLFVSGGDDSGVSVFSVNP